MIATTGAKLAVMFGFIKDERPKDGDGDGLVFDGTEQERPADPKIDDSKESVIDQWVIPAVGDRKGEYDSIRTRAEQWANGQPDDGFDDLYAHTQHELSKLGVRSVTAYRGVDVPSDHPLAKAIMAGKLKVGSSFNAEGMTVTGWSESKGVAEHFADKPLLRAQRQANGGKTIGLVFERDIDADDIIASASTSPGFIESEREVVAKNKGKSKLKLIGVYR